MAAATPLRQVPNLKRGTAFGGGGGSGSPGSPKSADPTLGVVIFVGSEVMLFAGLLSAFLISRASASFWPPPNQPRLPVALTGFNTVLLIVSGFTMWRVVRSLRQHNKTGAIGWMVVTTVLGALFLAIQGSEWARLIRFG